MYALILVKSQSEPSVLFSGDLILGSKSTFVSDLPVYMNSLKMLRDNPECHADYICVAHSESLRFEDGVETIIMDGPRKLDQYIKYREDRVA